MKRRVLFFLIAIAGINPLSAQVPSWSVDESLFEYSMTFVAKVNIGGERLTSSSDLVGAFVGGQCRGIANPTYIASSDAYFVYLTVFGNTVGETITFKVYKSATNEEVTINTSIVFETNQHIGSRFQSFSIAEPPLRSDADLISFGFNNQTADSLSINDTEVNFYFNDNIDESQLTPNFNISEGARAFINQIQQTSGVGVRDFSDPVVYQIMSEDESALNEVTIQVFDNYQSDSSGPDDSNDDNVGGQETTPPSFNISQSNENSIVSEDGTQDNFIVFLTQQPQTQAVFTITSSNPDEVRVMNPEIIFTPDDLSLVQFVYLEGVDDDIQDGNQTSTITIQIDPTRSDIAFATLPPKSFSCLTLDNDNVPRIVVVESNGNTQVDESQSEDTIFVSLGTQPTSNVNISIVTEDPTEVTCALDELTFTPENWFVPQALVVTGVDDDLNDGSQKSNITFSVINASSAENYRDLTPIIVEVTTTDNDASTNENDNDNEQEEEDENDNISPPQPPIFYKKNAVCYNGGAIKIEYEINGTNAILNFNGRLLNSQDISGGEAIFTNLERGTYVVEIANVVKVINIDLDE